MIEKRRLLAYLANGVQGGAVVRQGLSRGYHVRALVRDQSRSAQLTKLGAEIIEGDLASGAGLEAAHDGIDFVVLQIPPAAPAAVEVMVDHVIRALRSNRILKVIVKMGSGKPTVSADVPSFAMNRLIEEKMQASRIPFAIVRPTLYLDNLLTPEARQAICRDGAIVYPLAAHRAIAWTSVDDAARAALTLLENEAGEGDYTISGPAAVDGNGLALAFSQALGRDIQFQSLPLEVYERNVDLAKGAGMGRRFSAVFRFIDEQSDAANAMLGKAFKPQAPLRGFEPTRIEAWVGENRELFT